MQNKLFRYGAVLTSHDIWKAAAILLMVVDHVGAYFLTDVPELRLIGRLSFPLFFFLIGFGYISSTHKETWAPLSWVVGAVLLVVGNAILGRELLPLNILVSALAVRAFLKAIEVWRWFPEYTMALILLAVLWHYPLVMVFEYGGCAVLFALLGYAVARNSVPRISYAIAGVAVITYTYVQSVSFGFSSVYIVVLAGALCVMAHRMLHYRLLRTQLNITSPRGLVVALCARYSLELYVVHLLVFRAMASEASLNLF